jgi:DNA invertase Pin-like site-specific DNA recombinase
LSQITALYTRVSGRSRDTRSQVPDLKRWAADHQDETIQWFRDKLTGKTMDRPGFQKLLAEVEAGKVARIVVWRLDRLGCTAKGLTALFEDLTRRHVDLVSLKEGLELATPAGRSIANVLASVAAYETEVRAEKIRAGQATARASGKVWGGSPPGRRLKVTAEQESTVHRLKREGQGVTTIARATGLSRPTIYRVLKTETSRSGASKSGKPRRSRRSGESVEGNGSGASKQGRRRGE